MLCTKGDEITKLELSIVQSHPHDNKLDHRHNCNIDTCTQRLTMAGSSSIVVSSMMRQGLLGRPLKQFASCGSSTHGPTSIIRILPLASLSTAAKSFSSTSLDKEDAAGVTTPSSTDTTTTQPTLKEVPSLPVVGSMISAYSGYRVNFKGTSLVSDIRERNKEFGPFYSVGLPGFGVGLYCTIYVLSDPDVMAKILRQEAAYPSGIVEGEWPLIDWMERKGYRTVGFMKRGPEWKRIRTFLQKDLLAPASARGYLPGTLYRR